MNIPDCQNCFHFRPDEVHESEELPIEFAICDATADKYFCATERQSISEARCQAAGELFEPLLGVPR